MKMKKYFGIFTAVLMIAAGCAKEIMPSVDGQYTILTAGVEATKTVLAGMKVYWTDGDRISVNGVTSDALSLETPSASAEFRLPGELNTPYKAVFPASIYKNETTVTMPSVQEYHESSFHSQASPMVAYSTTGNLSFSHPFSVVCVYINLSEDTDKISYVEFSGNDNEQVCGDFTVDYSAKTLAGAGANAANKAVRVNVGQSISAGTPMAVHIVVPARTYSKGFSVKVADEKGHYMVQSTSSEKVYAAGKVYDMTPFDFVPTDTELNVEITSAADLIAFAEAWNKGGTYGANTVVTLAQDITFSEDDNAAWPGIGDTDDIEFTGHFDGNEKSISGFTSSTALFPYIGTSGKVENLTLAGDVTYDLTDCDLNTNVGPLAKRTQGNLIDCNSEVNVVLTSTKKITNEFRAGGVSGLMAGGSMVGCCYSGNLEWDENSSTSGTSKIGGIVGYINTESASLEECSLAGIVSLNASSTGTMYAGGIVGTTKSSLLGCYTTSEATVTVKGPRKVRFGGLVGFASDGTYKISDCTNNAEVSADCPSYVSGSYVDLGGVVGRIGSGVELKAINNGLVTLTAGGLTHRVGGIVGYNYGGTVTNSTNNKQIKSTDGYLVGTCTVDDVAKDTTAIAYMGGCVGYSTSNISSCTNNGKVSLPDTGKHAEGKPGRGLWMGGVVGYFSGTSLSGCTNNATVYNGYFDNDKDVTKATATGGVVGYLVGTSDARIQVSNCQSYSIESTYVSGKRGWVGGVCGYAQYADFASVTNTSQLTGTGFYYGGLSGQLNNSTMIDSSAEAAMTNLATNTLKYAGGIAGSCSNTVSVSNTTFKGDISSGYESSAKGAFSGYAAGTAVLTISGCKFSGTIDGTSVTAATLDDLSIGSKKSGASVTLTGNSVF